MTGSSLRDLHSELQSCQQRLGTSAESSGDFERALALAHEINNQVAAEYLRVAVTSESNPPTLIDLCRRILWPQRRNKATATLNGKAQPESPSPGGAPRVIDSAPLAK